MALKYTPEELDLIQRMPDLPDQAWIAPSNVWIIQWLREADPNSGEAGDRQTGVELHQWLETRRPRWAHIVISNSKNETLAAIERATFVANKRKLRPILHIEAHGCAAGIEGPDGRGGTEQIEWAELRARFARLNAATQFNLLIFMAACTGFAGIDALIEFNRAPALALVGSGGLISDQKLLEGAKEFYRRIIAGDSTLHETAAEASREAGEDVWFEPEIFPVLARESLIDMIMGRTSNGRLTPSDSAVIQAIWNRLMMIDLYPMNEERFRLDVRGIMEQAASFYNLKKRP